MRPSRMAAVAAAVALVGPATLAETRAETVPFSSARWELRGGETRIVQHLGRESLYVKGGMAWLRDVEFLDGVIEFDVAVTGERGFMGAIWRVQDEGNFEEFYIRPHQSGNPDANQYTPVYDGLAAWQLYHGEGFGAPVEYRWNEWMHVRIVISGSQGEVYIDSEDPVLFMDSLKRPVRPGRIGIRSAGFAPAHFSNFGYELMESPVLRGAPIAAPPAGSGALEARIPAWQVSNAFDGSLLEGKFLLTDNDTRGLSWIKAEAEPSGILNLAKLAALRPKADTIFARVAVRSDRVQVKRLSFGYSDRVKAFFNGRLVYGGSNVFRSRDYRYLGTIGLFDDLYLPLRKGDNELCFAVSESFGGWGILAKLEDMEGITLSAEDRKPPAQPGDP